MAADVSGAHLNPAVTLALVLAGKFSASLMPLYISAQLLGAMFGSGLAWLAYKKHFDATDDADAKLAVFCTMPNIRSYWYNVVTEIIGTYVLSLAVLYMAKPDVGLGCAECIACCDRRSRNRSCSGRSDRLCHQSGPRSWSAYNAFPFTNKEQARQRLEVLLGTNTRSDGRSISCCCDVFNFSLKDV